MLGSVLVEGKKEVDEEIYGGCKQKTRAGPNCGGSLMLGGAPEIVVKEVGGGRTGAGFCEEWARLRKSEVGKR